jgi:hypothetical protein
MFWMIPQNPAATRNFPGQYGVAEMLLKGASKNSKLCVTLYRQNAHLPGVNSAFASVASLDFEVFRGALKGISKNVNTTACARDKM